ncbi:MAG: flagellar hook-length control protein FliK [Betaproteobacteria bacterium]|nr:flagellar hook-length control protein FliK [Betaproteobacteria bacterium]
MPALNSLNLLIAGMFSPKSVSAGTGAYGDLSGAADSDDFAGLLIDRLLELDPGEDPALIPLPQDLLSAQEVLTKLAPELADLPDPDELPDVQVQDPAALFAALGMAPVTPPALAAQNPVTPAAIEASAAGETPLLHDPRATLAERLAPAGKNIEDVAGNKAASKPVVTGEQVSARNGDELAATAKKDPRAASENGIAGSGGSFTGNSEKAAAKLAAAPEPPSLQQVIKSIAEPQVKAVAEPAHGLVAAASTLAQPAASSPSEAALRISVPVSGDNWASELGQKILWLAGNDRQSAQLSLNPAHLGPVDISLNIDGDRRATMVFASPHAEVREAIENALPRLRELFANANIELGQTDVSAESFRQQQQQNALFQQSGGNSQGSRYPQDGSRAGESAPVPAGIPATRRGSGLINTFA